MKHVFNFKNQPFFVLTDKLKTEIMCYTKYREVLDMTDEELEEVLEEIRPYGIVMCVHHCPFNDMPSWKMEHCDEVVHGCTLC